MACKDGKCGKCSQCQKSILNNQSSIIPNPLCTPTCPPSEGCTDTLPTECIIYNGGTLPCIGVYTGYNLNSILANVNTQICAALGASGLCTIKVDVNDTNCGFLSPKIQTNSLAKSINNVGGNESIQLELKSWSWTQFNPLLNGFTNAGTIQAGIGGGNGTILPTTNAAYGVRCSGASCNYDDVRFRGYIMGPTNVTSGFSAIVAILPLVAAPDVTKVFSYSYYSGTIPVDVTATIDTSGNIRLLFNSIPSSQQVSQSGGIGRIQISTTNNTFNTFFSMDVMNFAK